MKVVSINDAIEPTTDDPESHEVMPNEVISQLRMHDQMLNCITFVIEKASQMYGSDVDLEPLYESVELVTEQRTALARKLRA